MNEKNSDQKNWLRSFGLFGVIVADVLGYTVVGAGLGYLGWKKLGLPWWLIPITSSVGLGLAFYRVYQLSKKELD